MLPVYPYYDGLKDAMQSCFKGNFGLWYNKLIPLKDFKSLKVCDDQANTDKPVEFYLRNYDRLNCNNSVLKNLIEQKHIDQSEFCDAYSSIYEKIVFKVKLKTPLLTGSGESHPHEISMVFDWNMGIPYIPASGIKGIVRFAHTVDLILSDREEFFKEDKSGRQYFDDEEEGTNIPKLFGTQSKKGRVVFLDAYPEAVPALHIDILNPHYGEYYSDDETPTDNSEPVPVKFLTVARDTVFIFRALVEKDKEELTKRVKYVFRKVFEEEGIGAKTAIGYGRFNIVDESEASCVTKHEEEQKKELEAALKKKQEEFLESMSPDDAMIYKISKMPIDSGPEEISNIVNEILGKDSGREVYEAIKNKLIELGAWKPDGSKQKKKKMTERNKQIESKINS